MPRLAAVTLAAIKRGWAAELGCAPEHFDTDRTVAVPRKAGDAADSIFLFVYDQALVVTAPPSLLPSLGRRVAQLRAVQLTPAACLEAVGAERVERVIGPAYYGYADAGTLCSITGGGVRWLEPADAPLLAGLPASCSPPDWEEAGALHSALPLVGQFVGAALVAVAGYRVWPSGLAHLGVVTHPGYRGRGYGTVVVQRLAAEALRQGLVPQYRARMVNKASIAIATALGFEPCATSIALRLKPSTP